MSLTPDGGWLPSASTAALLSCYGIPLAADEDIPAGTEVTVRVADDRVFGPLVVFELGSAASQVLADRAARLTPLTDADADKLIHSVRSLPPRGAGQPAADLKALRDLLLRVSRLATDLPEVTDLELSPVIAGPDGVAVVNAQVRAAPYEPHDPYLRKLR